METISEIKKDSLLELLASLDANSERKTINETFEKIAKELLYNYHIQKGSRKYELLEIEFYFYSDKHRDIITYPRNSDKPGMWFFHMSGVDITFGSTERNDNNSYGGILVRSMIRTDEGEPLPISGPMKCVEELFDYIHAIDHEIKNDIPYLVRNEKDNYTPKFFASEGKEPDHCPRFIPFKNKTNENVMEKIQSKLYDLNRRRGKDIILEEFVSFLKAEYRYYIECDEKYWNNKYLACPLKSKKDKNDNRFLCK